MDILENISWTLLCSLETLYKIRINRKMLTHESWQSPFNYSIMYIFTDFLIEKVENILENMLIHLFVGDEEG